MMFFVYRIMNKIDGKSYIGTTSKTTTELRLKQHCRAAKMPM